MPQVSEQDKKAYQAYVDAKMPQKKTVGEYVCAFAVGGLICVIGQVIAELSMAWFEVGKEDAGTITAIVLIALAALLTGLGVFDNIGKIAGAGAFVPITGFSNAIVASAMEFRREGLILGVGAKMFAIAGPVLVYGIGTSVIIGLISLLL